MGPGTGVVVEFDDHRGYGVVERDGGGTHPFHCTAVADGSRTIEVGTKVSFVVAPGRMGRWEATHIRPV